LPKHQQPQVVQFFEIRDEFQKIGPLEVADVLAMLAVTALLVISIITLILHRHFIHC
jgi:hypothetical protein